MKSSAAAEAAKGKAKYNSTLKKLQARAEHQVLLLQQAKEGLDLEHELQHVLADGICQQKVLYEHLKPLHNAWLQGDHMKGWEPTGNMECDTLVKLVDNCNPMLSAMLMANPQQVQEAACLTRDEVIQTHTKLFMELLVLLELNSPERYHGEEELLLSDGSTTAAQGEMPGGLDRQLVGDLPGSCSSDPAAVEAEAHAVASAAVAAEEHLNELIKQSLLLGGLLVVHQPGLLMDMCSTNLANKQRCVAPLGHFTKAANRLGFNEDQRTQLRLMLQQYNRSMHMLMQEGMALLQVSQRSSASLKATAEANTLSGSTKLGQDSTATNTPAGSGNGSSDQEGGDAGAGVDGQQLSDSMQKHVEERMQVMQLMGFWVANTLSPRQMAKFIVYSWPYYPLCSALAEASTLLRPTAHNDSNTDAKDTETFMAWRRDGMRKELEWLMKHTAEMADTCLRPVLD